MGDQLLVTTKNSIYSIYVQQEGLYSIFGGWFDRRGLSPCAVAINGCTWGGRAIKLDVLAACGLHLEFNNHCHFLAGRQELNSALDAVNQI